MADTSSQVEAHVSRPANQFIPYHSALHTKRPLSEVHYSSYGESEATPTPKSRETQLLDLTADSDPDSSSLPSHSTPPPAQVARDTIMEDSEDESDEYYDQFDLGDFTKEEIRIYEAMVGPGERLRDAAPPAKPLAEVLESSCERPRALVVEGYC